MIFLLSENVPSNQDWFQKFTKYDQVPYAKVAISFVIHNEPGLFEMLFHVLFKPYNSFCLYIDAKASKEFKSVIHSIINCYQVIFPKNFIVLAPITSHVNWGGYSLINADLTCLDKLHFSNRYLISIAS